MMETQALQAIMKWAEDAGQQSAAGSEKALEVQIQMTVAIESLASAIRDLASAWSNRGDVDGR